MKNKTGKEDRLISDIMKDFRMESPSPGFTERVIQGIHAQSDNSVPVSSPLISRAGWIGIAAGFFILLGIIISQYDSDIPSESGILAERLPSVSLPAIDFSFPDLFNWINLDSPTLFWIFTGIGGIFLLGLLERVISKIGFRYFFIL